ncbi:glycosyltransferase involved in cell wall biosynthesis [Paenibacillus sp. 4624]|uniref:glycosyltransferase family 2 protein n=1 Tax=Paenibacillus sp. 4624 TaxID=3156453 RepID=UPI003D2574A1
MKILVIVPAYNEADNIQNLIMSLRHEIEVEFDIVVINDCSTDSTSNAAFEVGANVIDLPCNLGIGGAVQTGYKYAYKHNYDIAIQVDGDGQHNPKFIKDLIEPIILKKADFVIGSRFLEREGFQSSALRRIGIVYFSKIIYLLTKQKVTDPTSGFRACNASIIKMFANSYPIDYPEPETIVFLKRNEFTIKEIPVVMEERVGGVSSINLLKSVYYMVKVSIAILIDLMRDRKGVIKNGSV